MAKRRNRPASQKKIADEHGTVTVTSWREEGVEYRVLDLGRIVICDRCNSDWTESSTSGGIYLAGYSWCPDCAPRRKPRSAVRCPRDMSFADWVRDVLR